MVSLIIPCWNNFSFTQQCIESVEAYTPEEHEIIFIDNGSTDGTTGWLKEKTAANPNYTLIRNERNEGFVKACNQGASFAKGDYLLFLNNDTVVSKEWLTGLMEAIKSDSDIACVGPRTNNISGPQQVNDEKGYDTLFKYQVFAESYRKAHKGYYIPFWRIVGFCLLVSKKIWDELEGFDERFSPGNFEDDDFCLRACMAGYRNLVASDVFIHHHGSKSCNKLDFKVLLDINKRKFTEKWDEMTGKTISAVMIVKNEAANIGDCIVRLHPYVNEIIVVDTGSTDDTKRLAERASGKVITYDFPWCDDYSAARNFANSKATKDWLFSIDADEEVTGLDTLKLQPYRAYRIVTRNYNNNPKWSDNNLNTGEFPEQERGQRWFTSTKIRLWPNDKRIVFEYPVHEVVEQSVYHLGVQIIDCPEVIVHHYGRLNDNYEYGRGDKYWQLLLKQLESGKNDKRSLEQLALQAQQMGKYKEARKYWDDFLVLDPKYSKALLNIGHCHAEEGNWKDALIWSRKAMEANPNSKDAAMNTATCECMAGSRETAKKICEDLKAKYPSYPLHQGLLNALSISEKQGGEKHDGI